MRKPFSVRTLSAEEKDRRALRPGFLTNKQDVDTSAKMSPEAVLAVLHPNAGRITVLE